MKLITSAISKKLPLLYETDGKDKSEIKVPLKLFNPYGGETWYITEMDIHTGEMFGWCNLGTGTPELGYVSFGEIEGVREPLKFKIERDMYWDMNNTLQQVIDGEVS